MTDILLVLQKASHSEFVATDRGSFHDLQAIWKEEMDVRFQELVRTEKEVKSHKEELDRLQRRQVVQELKLNARERALMDRERELQERELRILLTASHERPRPVKRSGGERSFLRFRRPGSRKKAFSKEDIMLPEEGTFHHVFHMGPPRPDGIPVTPGQVGRSRSLGKADSGLMTVDQTTMRRVQSALMRGESVSDSELTPTGSPRASPCSGSRSGSRSRVSISVMDEHHENPLVWHCPQCSYGNPPLALQCGMCDCKPSISSPVGAPAPAVVPGLLRDTGGGVSPHLTRLHSPPRSRRPARIRPAAV